MFGRSARVIAITGASGYIGRRLTAMAAERDWTVFTLGRGPAPFAGLRHLPFDLADPALPDFPVPLDAFVHLACDTTGLNAERLDLPAARLLAGAFAGSPTRLVFVSSQTASPQALTPYGRAKAAVEDVMRPAGAIIIRPGLVYGGDPAGLWGVIRALVVRLPVLPALLPAPKVQPIQLDDLCAALLAAADGAGQPGQTLAVGAPVPVPITAFLGAIAQHALRRRRFFVPAPTGLLLLAAFAASTLAPKLRAQARQLLSLTRLPQMSVAADLATLGVTPRSLAAGMRGKAGQRRERLAEGARLLGHILGARPPSGALRRYVRATEVLRLEPLHDLRASRLGLYAPVLSQRDLARLGLPEDLPQRMRLALAVAEGSSATAGAFYRTAPQASPVALLGLIWTVAAEAPFLALRALGGRIGRPR